MKLLTVLRGWKMKLFTVLRDCLRGYSEVDRVNALEKVYDAMPEGGETIYLTSREFKAFKVDCGHPRHALRIFERNNNNHLFEITVEKQKQGMIL